MSAADRPPGLGSKDQGDSVVVNERTKLTATYLNGLAISIFAIGGLAPIFNVFYGSALASLPVPAVPPQRRRLLSGKRSATSHRTSKPPGTALMNTLNYYSLFAMPCAGIAIAMFLLWYTRRAH